MSDVPRTGEQPAERRAPDEGAGAPVAQPPADRNLPDDGDQVVEPDGAGLAGGSSGGSGGGSGMPGHPDAAR